MLASRIGDMGRVCPAATAALSAAPRRPAGATDLYEPVGLLEEVSTAIYTAAAGGNASLISVG